MNEQKNKNHFEWLNSLYNTIFNEYVVCTMWIRYVGMSISNYLSIPYLPLILSVSVCFPLENVHHRTESNRRHISFAHILFLLSKLTKKMNE